MKLEETNDTNTILIEATDERSAVMNQVSKQTKPVIIVLPEQADQIFRQPGDFFELKRLKRERGIAITFVISGHERIRAMARRQGFQVYTSAETCVRAIARRDRLYTMRGISLPGTTGNLDQTRFTAQGENADEDTPWSYDVQMQQAAMPSASFTARGDEGDEDTPWSYDVQMQQTEITVAIPKATRKQTRELSSSDVPPWSYDVQKQQTPSMQGGDEDTPWSYDVQMSQDETPTQPQHPQRTAWMLAEEELWNQNHHVPTQHDQYIPPSYMVRAPLAGALPGAHNSGLLNAGALPGAHNSGLLNAGALPGAHNSGLLNAGALPGRSASQMGGPVSLGGNAASLWETPVPPYFTETLQNLIALSGEKLAAGHPQGMPLPYTPNAHNSGALDADARVRPTRFIRQLDEIPTRPAAFVQAQSVRYAPETEPLYPLRETRPLTENEHAGSHIALMLTALLILGILGGVCCGYILTLMHVNLTVLTSWNYSADTINRSLRGAIGSADTINWSLRSVISSL